MTEVEWEKSEKHNIADTTMPFILNFWHCVSFPFQCLPFNYFLFDVNH